MSTMALACCISDGTTLMKYLYRLCWQGNKEGLDDLLLLLDLPRIYHRSYLVTEVHACGRVSNLWDVEQLEEVLHLDGHRAGPGSNQAHDGLFRLHHQAPPLRRAPSLALLLLVGHQRVPDELDALLQRHRGVPARVPALKTRLLQLLQLELLLHLQGHRTQILVLVLLK